LLAEFNPIIGVTGLNATDNPGPGISVIRAIRAHPEFKGSIVGLAYDPLDPGLYAGDLIDSAYMMPYPSEGVETLRQRLQYVQNSSHLDMVIPTLDSELSGFINLEEELKRMGIRVFLPTKNQYEIRSKVRLKELCLQAGLRAPQTRVISDQEALYQLGEKIPYPLVLKGLFYGAWIVNNIEESLAAFYRITAQWGLPVIVQEFLAGEEYDILSVGDGEGDMVGAVSMKKTYLTDKGKGWAGVTVKDPRLLDIAEKFTQVTKWRGPCEIEILKTRDEEYYLLEVNPRFPAWTYLSAGAGQNLPFALVQLAHGIDPRPLPAYQAGIMFVRISLEQITSVNTLEKIISGGEIHYQPEAARSQQGENES
jgi:carbamoyl-phosphate synthase large subunit